MHVMRPKSAKGRTRPKLTDSRTTDDELLHERRPFSPHPPSHPPRPPPTPSHRFESSLSPRTFFRHSNPCSAGETAFNVPVLSLNKFKVLPSIEKRSGVQRRCPAQVSRCPEVSSADTEEKTSRSRLHTCHFLRSDPELVRAFGTVRPSSWCQESETSGSWVLLALRTPCGQRLKCQFKPTDTLRDIVATAEDLSGKPYKHVLIETMEVPRRSFTNLNMTLSQCGIVSKSVLCISFRDGP